jgi:hypothetical protein
VTRERPAQVIAICGLFSAVWETTGTPSPKCAAARRAPWVRRADGRGAGRAGERPAILKAYLSKRAASKSPEYEAREFFGVSPNPTIGELAAIANGYPVFRIVPLR